jgi:hypothetical protein
LTRESTWPRSFHFARQGRADFSKYKANPIDARRRAEKSLKYAAHTLDRPKVAFFRRRPFIAECGTIIKTET